MNVKAALAMLPDRYSAIQCRQACLVSPVNRP